MRRPSGDDQTVRQQVSARLRQLRHIVLHEVDAMPSLTEAIAWADRHAAILGGNEVDVRQMAD